jgi:hypothetical protein
MLTWSVRLSSMARCTPGRTSGEPGMFMKIQQLSAESRRGLCPLLETKRMKLNGLLVLVIGNHGEDKR